VRESDLFVLELGRRDEAHPFDGRDRLDLHRIGLEQERAVPGGDAQRLSQRLDDGRIGRAELRADLPLLENNLESLEALRQIAIHCLPRARLATLAAVCLFWWGDRLS
jgi:hypothetical protein